ncbi:TIGR03757 family integrating conjugative element protein [Pseudomonas sp. LJDD11]|uniref:TIGR03757 family integrating conjugative element protein n=1 Tax=Pseudomonas sp. LJDD11 TaxID=2931984 RepID=UPI00211CFBEA|nr:TIGR03757 family integrating conjugative element protein [Pseudomonas sp. LJDD11]MCQ9422313.1 TIGR03757 family integrating conjugative element protein [Pseudomonas sp. LJDD11]
MAILRSPLTFIVSMLLSLTLHADTLVITDSNHPTQPTPDSKIILIDQPSTLESSLSTNLPSDPHQAQTIAQQRLTPELTAKITQAHQEVVTAWSLGITKIPAVVVDQKYVVYGEPDVQRALALIARHREQVPQP